MIPLADARDVSRYCRVNDHKYVHGAGYRSAMKIALREQTRLPNGVLYHTPRDWVNEMQQCVVAAHRVYVIWVDEAPSLLYEACEYVKALGTGVKIFVVRKPFKEFEA